MAATATRNQDLMMRFNWKAMIRITETRTKKKKKINGMKKCLAWNEEKALTKKKDNGA